MATLWTEVLTPAEITGFARASQEDYEQTQGTLARWLPNTTVTDVVVRTIVGVDGSGELAQYRSFDAETPIASGGAAERKVFELLPLGLKERISEYEQLRARGRDGAALVLGGAERAAQRVVRAIVNRLEIARGQALEAGQVAINENGVVQTVPFGRPEDNEVTASTLWSANGASPIENLNAWVEYYADVNNGATPGALVTSKRVLAALQRSEEIRAMAASLVGTPSIVSVEMVNNVLTSYGLPPIYLYDRKVKGERVTSDNKVFILPAPVDPNTGANELGATFLGPTLEAGEPEYGIGASEQPGIAVGVWKTKDPIAAWVHANATAFPVLVNPVASMVAEVLADSDGS
ncbi:major head protein [Mycobacterium phage ThetaBob]|uniref:Major capsid protein n=2 Tax=Thetabobvirus TaxID=2843467 RepID=A0A385E202_9CAUD|nr:major head protein [Mycobacterium phage Renaud18]YP_009848826.1 major head protein [Mycobacterium phage ThetaBob]UCR74383.1 major capsid protein [Mycobacterium phage Saroj]UZV39533.1 major capsid protein [Mycobacterium phage Ritam007]AXQ64918.1 major capsid protein [Mycobacterium phage Renaud18]QDF19894.1 major capsid protein [Mycobacterium phage ThetaBob]